MEISVTMFFTILIKLKHLRPIIQAHKFYYFYRE